MKNRKEELLIVAGLTLAAMVFWTFIMVDVALIQILIDSLGSPRW